MKRSLAWLIVFLLVLNFAPCGWGLEEEEDPFRIPSAGEKRPEPVSNVSQEAPAVSPEPSAEKGEPLPQKAAEENALEESRPPVPEPAAKIQTAAETPSGAIAMLDDFNGGVRSNLLGGAMGVWSKDEYDDTQGCEIDFVEHPRLGKSGGYSMQISYDVDSPNPAYNGVWIKLEDFDARPYSYLVMYLKAPNSPPYGTDRVKLELRNARKEMGSYMVTRIPRGAWREYKIPLKKFKGLKDLSALDELVLVFEDKTSNPKEGILYLENIYFTKGEIRRPE
jgi:hypothetical protein